MQNVMVVLEEKILSKIEGARVAPLEIFGKLYVAQVVKSPICSKIELIRDSLIALVTSKNEQR